MTLTHVEYFGDWYLGISYVDPLCNMDSRYLVHIYALFLFPVILKHYIERYVRPYVYNTVHG